MINGTRAAWYFKDSIIFPFSNAIKLLCIPQPGHSKPIYDLKKQENKWCSNQSIIFVKMKMPLKLSKAFFVVV